MDGSDKPDHLLHFMPSKKIAVAAFRDALSNDFEMARERVRDLSSPELKELQKACMALQNIAQARLYALAQGRETSTQSGGG